MSEVKDLSGITQNTNIVFEGTEAPKDLLFKNISASAKLTVTIRRQGQSDFKIVNDLKVSVLMEVLSMVNTAIYQNNKPYVYINHDTTEDPVTQLPVIPAFLFPLADGEIPLGANDKVVVSLTNLGKIADCSISSIGGKNSATRLFQLFEETMKSTSKEHSVSFASDRDVMFLTVAPDETSIYVDKDVVRFSDVQLDLYNEDAFPILFYNVGNTIQRGANQVYIANISDANQVILNHNAEVDITVYTLKL